MEKVQDLHRLGGGRRKPWRQQKVLVAGVLLAVVVLAACGSGTSSAKSANTTPTTSGGSVPTDTKLGNGVTPSTVKLGVALVDFKEIEPYTDTIRTTAEQKQIYSIYINDINAHGGIAGRKIVPDYKFYSPLGSAGIVALCTSFAQDDNVFAVVGTFIDFSGDAQTCIANQEKRVLMTFNLTQAIMDKSPAGLIVTAGSIPERAGAILLQLLKKQGTLNGKTVAILGDTNETAVVKGTIEPALKDTGAKMGTTAILTVDPQGDTTAAQAQLDSFIEKWKTEGVNALFLSGNLASTKQFVEKVKKNFPDMLLMSDNQDTLEQAQQEQQAGKKPNPYEGILTAGGLSPQEYTASANWKYCADIYQKATGKVPENATQTIKTPDGKIDDTYGTINDACQTLTMFHDIGQKVGKYLNNTNWVNTVNTFGHIENRGSGPYSSLHTGKYSADDNWRVEEYDSSLGATGLWKPVTPLENVTGS
jgi:ABC-type branched-subunit amino acid transport system substrate-binding protein